MHWKEKTAYNNIRALTNTKCNDIGSIRLDRYEIVSNNSQCVVVDAEFLDTLSTSIDDPDEMLLS